VRALQACAILATGLLLAVPASAVGPRGAPPPPGPPPPARVPTIQAFEGPRELKVLLVTDTDLPMVRASFVFADAARAEAANQRGLAVLTARVMLYGGVRDWELDIDFLGERTEGLAIVPDDSFVGLDFSCFPKDFGDVLEEIAHVLGSPLLDKKFIDSSARSAVTALSSSRVSSGRVGSERVRKLVLKWHREEIDAWGSEATLRALKPDDVRRFHDAWFRPDHATLIVVGDITRETLEKALAEELSAWDLADVPEAPLTPPPPPKPPESRLVVLHRAGVVQSKVFVAALGPPSGSDELAAAAVLAEILGGGLDSRLDQLLREEQADSYGLAAHHEVMPDAGILWLAGAVDADATAGAIAQIFEILDDLGATSVSAEELRAAQAVLEGRVMRGAATTSGMLGQLRAQIRRGRDPANPGGWIEEVRAVTADDVKRAAGRWLGAEARTVLVVGDAARIGPSLERLGMPVETKYRKGERPAN